MKISHISPSYKPAYCYGGPTQSVSLLCEALNRQKLPIEVLTTTANGAADLPPAIRPALKVDGVLTYYFPSISKDPVHLSPQLILHLLRTATNDQHIIHIHSWWNLVSMSSCLIAKWKRIPVILSPRGMLSDYSFRTGRSRLKSLMHRIIGAWLIRYCHIHCTSEQEKTELLQCQESSRISVIPNLIETNIRTTKRIYEIDNGIFKMIFLSRIDPKKGLELYFHALSKLDYRWSLTIAGTGNAEYLLSLQRLAEELGISAFIHWLGLVDRTNKYNLISRHDLLVLFSYNENFGNVVLESLVTGTPVAVSDSVGLAAYVKSNALGWVCKLKASDIAKTLYMAFRDQEKRQRIRQTAPAIIREHYNQALLTQQYLQLYRQML